MEKPRPLPNGKFQARYTDPSGKRRSAGAYKTKKQATVALNKVHADIARGLYKNPVPETRLRDYAAVVLKARKGSKTLSPESWKNMESSLRLHVLPQLGDLSLNDILYTTVLEWFNTMPQKPYRRTAYLALSNVMKYAVRDRLIPVSPCQVEGATEVVSPKKAYFSPDQIWDVIDELPERLQIAAVVQFGGGLRISEMCALNWSDVNLETGAVKITKQFFKGKMVPHTKNKEDRTIVLTAWALEALREHRMKYPTIGPAPIFLNAAGSRLNAKNVYEQWGPARKRAGVPGIKCQDQRHTDLSNYRATTGDLVKAMARAGHKDQRSQLNYQHAEATDDSAAIAALSDMTGRKAI